MGSLTGSFQILLISCLTLYFLEKVDCRSYANIGSNQILGQSVYSSGGLVNQYQAIPYAEAPVGNLRFKKPVPKKYFPVVFAAFNPPPACWQGAVYPFPWYDPSPMKDEDCLFLNIWSPADAGPDNQKAVIYFIHDGGFRFGSISQSSYNGAPLAAHGDVIVVTVNYRLEAFGFLTSGTDEAPGNIALYDILEGLKWVNKNIEAFGGDKSRITIAGIGAGSTAAGILATSPLAKGLFTRTIMGSGSPGYPDKNAAKKNRKISQKVAEALGCANETHTIQDNPSEVVDCLRNVEPEALTNASKSIKPKSTVLFAPQFGDELAPMNPAKALRKGNFSCNNLLIGNTHDEGSYLLTTHIPEVYGFFGALNPSINKTEGKKQMKRLLSGIPGRDGIIKHYLPHSLPSDAYNKIREQVYTSLGDASIVCPATFYADQCAAKGGDVYYYIWNHRPSNSIWYPWMGVVHATDVEFVFGIPLLHSFQYYSDEETLSKNIIELWSSFAKDGKPSIPWPEFSKEDPQVKVLGPSSMDEKDQKGFHRENCDFLRPYYGFKK